MDTVYDRTKKTGFMMGGGHKFGAAFNMQAKPGMPGGKDEEPDPNDPNEGAEDEPPNLRDSIDSGECCGACANFNAGDETGKSSCDKFNGYPVTGNQVCDVFQEKEPDDAKEMLDRPQGDVRNDAAMPGA